MVVYLMVRSWTIRILRFIYARLGEIMKPISHHATLVPCLECARLRLGLRMAKDENERRQWQRLIDNHHQDAATAPTRAGDAKLEQGRLM